MWENVFSVFLLFYEHVCECASACMEVLCYSWQPAGTNDGAHTCWNSSVILVMCSPQRLHHTVFQGSLHAARWIKMPATPIPFPDVICVKTGCQSGCALAACRQPLSASDQEMPPLCWQLPLPCSHQHPQGEPSSFPPSSMCCQAMHRSPNLPCVALTALHYTVYLNRAGAQRVPGNLLHSPPFREDLSSGKEDNEETFLLWLFKTVLSTRRGNSWIRINELSPLSVSLEALNCSFLSSMVII